MGIKKTSKLLSDVLTYSNKSFFAHSDIITNLEHDRGAIRRILILLVNSGWLKEWKEAKNIYYIKPAHTPQQLLEFLEEREGEE